MSKMFLVVEAMAAQNKFWLSITRLLGAMTYVIWILLVGAVVLSPLDKATEYVEEVSGIVTCFLSLVFCFTFYFFGPIASMVLNRFGYVLTLVIVFIGEVCVFTGMMFTPPCSNNYIAAIAYGMVFSFYNIITYTIIGTGLERSRTSLNNTISSTVHVWSVPVLVVIQHYTANMNYTDAIPNPYFFVALPAVSLCIIAPFVCLFDFSTVANMNSACGKLDKKLIASALFKDSAVMPLVFIFALGFDYEARYLVDLEVNQMASAVGLTTTENEFFFTVTTTLTYAISIFSASLYGRDTIFGVKVNRLHVLRVCFVGRFVTCLTFATLQFAPPVHYSIFVFVSTCYSITVGCSSALGITLLAELFGTDRLCSSLGLRSMVIGSFAVLTRVLTKIPFGHYMARLASYSTVSTALPTSPLLILVAALCSATSICMTSYVFKCKEVNEQQLCFEKQPPTDLPKEVETLKCKPNVSPENYDDV